MLRSMCETTKHRGPDSTGYYEDAGVGLGVNRLSIIDLVTGDQPIHNEDESVWLVHNGEVYNYVELKRELEAKGHSFYTETDTETVVHAYEEWGDDFVTHMRGMFASAIWDKKRKRLVIARDRFGKKPLFYAESNGVFLFGSEMKNILPFEGIKRTIDPEAVDYFFTYMYIPSPHTIFNEIHKLPPGCYAVFEKGKLSIHQYWAPDFAPDPTITEDAAIDALYNGISEAVRLRLRSDVPLGAFLSGGIDSSTVVAFMSRLSETPVKTVSVGFNEGVSELRYSRVVADLLKTDHHEVVVKPEAHKILPKLVWHFDEPFADHSMIPTYYVSEATRKEVKVALSGDGGDEMFLGYTFMGEPSSYRVYSKIPRPLRRAVLRTIISLPQKGGLTRMAQHAYEKDYGKQDPFERFVMRVSVYDREGLSRLYSDGFLETHKPTDVYGYVLSLLEEHKGLDLLSVIDYATIRSYLEEDILPKVDRMSMATSLEVRCPLLDQELAGFVEKIPSGLKLKNGVTKYVLKKMVVQKGLLPSSIANRKKHGFGAPIETWMKGEWQEVVKQQLDPVLTKNYTGLFNKDYVRKLLGDPYLYSNRLFGLTVFLTWYKMYVERGEIRAPVKAVL